MLQASGIVLSEDQTIWLTILPGQICPNHYHKQIKETFFIIAGDAKMTLDGKVIETITTHQIPDDSYFEDPGIRRYLTVGDG